MQPRPYIINGDFWHNTPCVVKLHYGNKYMIVKCKSQAATLKAIEKQLAAYIRGTSELKEESMYRFLFEYVAKHPDNKFKVEVLVQTDNAYQLLKREQQELDLTDPHCLNWHKEAYIPEYNPETELYGWIKKNEFLNYKRWMGKRKKKTA